MNEEPMMVKVSKKNDHLLILFQTCNYETLKLGCAILTFLYDHGHNLLHLEYNSRGIGATKSKERKTSDKLKSFSATPHNVPF